MGRAVAGVIAVIVGVTAWLASGLAQAGPDTLAAGWIFIYAIFVLPGYAAALAAGLAILEYVAVQSKWPRLAVFLGGGLLMPAVVGLVVFGALVGSHADATGFSVALMRSAMGPSFLACAVYAGLTIFTARKRQADGSMAAAPSPPPKAPAVQPPQPKRTNPFAPVVLKEPPASARLFQVMTWPEERIGQHLFMYCIQLWFLGASVWFAAPFVLGALLGFEQEHRLMVAALGWMALFWCAFCLVANRLHDLGVGAVWAGAPLMLALAWVVLEGPPAQGWYSMTSLWQWVLASVICYGLAAALLLTRKGEPWSNQYGPESS